MADPERADPIPTDDQWLMTEMMNSVDIDKLGGVDDKVDRSQAGPPKDFDEGWMLSNVHAESLAVDGVGDDAVANGPYLQAEAEDVDTVHQLGNSGASADTPPIDGPDRSEESERDLPGAGLQESEQPDFSRNNRSASPIPDDVIDYGPTDEPNSDGCGSGMENPSH